MALQSSGAKPETPQFEPQRQRSFLLIVGVIGLVVVVGFSIYLNLQKQAITEAQSKINEEITKLNQETKTLEGSKVKVRQQAQEWLATIEKDEILWSRVLGRLQSLIPFDAASKKPKITFVSYSGSQGGILSLNAQTRTATEVPFEDMADLLKTLNSSSYFTRAVIPTTTPGENDNGEKFLTFTLNLRYQEQDVAEQPSTTTGGSAATNAPAKSNGGPTPSTTTSSH